MAEFGSRFREARESKGLSLQEAEESTRIRRAFLIAIEEDRLDALPGHAYARGFVRNYARLLDLDPEEMAAIYRRLSGIAADDTPLILDEPLLRSRPPIWSAIFVGLMILLVLAIVGWYVYNRVWLGQNPKLPWQPWPTPAPTQVALATLRPTPTWTVAGVPSTPMQSTPVQSAPTEQANPSPTASPSVVAARPTASQVAVVVPTDTPWPTPVVRPRSPTPTIALDATPAPIEGVLVEARLTAESYLLVRVDGERVMEEILQSGETEVWQGSESVSLRIGNAAGVRLVVNGVEVDPLGSQGEVVEVTYTLDNLPQQ